MHERQEKLFHTRFTQYQDRAELILKQFLGHEGTKITLEKTALYSPTSSDSDPLSDDLVYFGKHGVNKNNWRFNLKSGMSRLYDTVACLHLHFSPKKFALPPEVIEKIILLGIHGAALRNLMSRVRLEEHGGSILLAEKSKDLITCQDFRKLAIHPNYSNELFEILLSALDNNLIPKDDTTTIRNLLTPEHATIANLETAGFKFFSSITAVAWNLKTTIQRTVHPPKKELPRSGAVVLPVV